MPAIVFAPLSNCQTPRREPIRPSIGVGAQQVRCLPRRRKSAKMPANRRPLPRECHRFAALSDPI